MTLLFRDAVKAEQPELTIGGIAKEISRRWLSLMLVLQTNSGFVNPVLISLQVG